MDADALIRAKSVALIGTTKDRVRRIDAANFPTLASNVARDMLAVALDELSIAAGSATVSAESLHSILIRFQDFVAQVEASNNEHISWPMVSYCDDFWTALFEPEKKHIFYSVTTEHNYTINCFSDALEQLLTPVLDTAARTRILNAQTVYCLRLASVEEANLPLYAIIGHEFGHAVWWSRQTDMSSLLLGEIDAVLSDVSDEFSKVDAPSAKRRFIRTAKIIAAAATELFCDLVGLITSGAASLLSLHEMSWGEDANGWRGRVAPNVTGYPSFAFRLHCLKRHSSLAAFQKDAQKAFSRLEKPQLKEMASYGSSLPSDHSKDSIAVVPSSDPDAAAISTALSNRLDLLKDALQTFLDKCDVDILGDVKAKGPFAAVSADNVAALIERLANDILPNIVPDGSLLGTPATFAEILNASAIYRIVELQEKRPAPSDIHPALQKLERLTSKAFEVSYIQKEFRSWPGKGDSK